VKGFPLSKTASEQEKLFHKPPRPFNLHTPSTASPTGPYPKQEVAQATTRQCNKSSGGAKAMPQGASGGICAQAHNDCGLMGGASPQAVPRNAPHPPKGTKPE
jgi:hypothetical protein